MKITKGKIIGIIVVAAVLAMVWIWGGHYAAPQDPVVLTGDSGEQEPVASGADSSSTAAEPISAQPPQPPQPPPPQPKELAREIAQEISAQTEGVTVAKPQPQQTMAIDPQTGKDKYQTDPVPDGKPLPVEPADAAVSNTSASCTISISCASILNNMSLLDKEKWELVPDDGVIL
ncbi:MAG: hypothetical protein RR332_03740, partial [Clostridiales bacterium]